MKVPSIESEDFNGVPPGDLTPPLRRSLEAACVFISAIKSILGAEPFATLMTSAEEGIWPGALKAGGGGGGGGSTVEGAGAGGGGGAGGAGAGGGGVTAATAGVETSAGWVAARTGT